MTVEEVIENELKCVQRDCCRLENECAKCDLVLPKEEIINAYNNTLRLEKENAELKDKLKNLESVAKVRLANWQKYEKENAVLKKRNIKDCKNFNMAVEKIGEQLNQKQYQLTKAKKIISNLYAICKDNHYPNTSVLMEQAEQFLKESE